MKIGFVGNEPAGPVLAKAWALAGHELVGAAVDSPEAIERVETLLPDLPIAGMAAVAEDADLVLLAVPYSDVEIVCDGLTDLGLFGPKKLIAHLSPLRGYGVLASAAQLGAVPIALHPVMHFSGTSMDLLVLKNSTIAISAPEMLLPIAQALAIELGGEPLVVQEHQRAAYAEAFEVASSFSSLVVQQAIGILEQAGVEAPAKLIGPVVRSAVDKALYQPVAPLDPEDLL
ncbi:MAG: DUF2520 domain-containing protein [Aquiluna sp.]|nr:DUF2520 domain-containing protein [Aquiluna sp.]